MKFLSFCLLICFAFISCNKPDHGKTIGRIDSLLLVVDSLEKKFSEIQADTLRYYFLKSKSNIDTINSLLGKQIPDAVFMQSYGVYTLVFRNLKRGLPLIERMGKELGYSRKQLETLRFDLKEGNIEPDSLVERYFLDEKFAVDKIQSELFLKVSLLPSQVNDMKNSEKVVMEYKEKLKRKKK